MELQPGSIQQARAERRIAATQSLLHQDRSAHVKTQVFDDVIEAAALLRRGGLVAFPTETVFGLGVDATNSAAIKRLFEAKGRPSDNPLIVHLAEVGDWQLVASELPEVAAKFLARFAPGPLTVVLPKKPIIASEVTAGLDTVGVRIPAYAVARKLIAATGLPIAAPSANLSGRPSGTTWQSVLEDLDGRIDGILRGDTSDIGIESTVVDCVSWPPCLLRPGAISLEDLRSIAPETVPLNGAVEAMVNSPGLRHAHYQPQARLHLIHHVHELEELWPEADRHTSQIECDWAKSAYCGLEEPSFVNELGACRVFSSSLHYARELYEFFRVVDRLGVRQIYCQMVPSEGIGSALNDRLVRAAKPT